MGWMNMEKKLILARWRLKRSWWSHLWIAKGQFLLVGFGPSHWSVFLYIWTIMDLFTYYKVSWVKKICLEMCPLEMYLVHSSVPRGKAALEIWKDRRIDLGRFGIESRHMKCAHPNYLFRPFLGDSSLQAQNCQLNFDVLKRLISPKTGTVKHVNDDIYEMSRVFTIEWENKSVARSTRISSIWIWSMSIVVEFVTISNEDEVLRTTFHYEGQTLWNASDRLPGYLPRERDCVIINWRLYYTLYTLVKWIDRHPQRSSKSCVRGR